MRTRLQVVADREALERRRAVGTELRTLREDAGLPKSVVAAAAGVDPTFLGRVEAAQRDASLEVLCRIAAVLGAEIGLRVFPSTGPVIHDRIQAPMVEALLQIASPTWHRHVEVAVRRPARGVIDIVLARPEIGRILSVQAHSDLRRLEQQIRWAGEKSDSLPSAVIWPALVGDGVPAAVSRVLLLRSTVRTRELARTFAETLAAAYPADPTEVYDALVDATLPWPGNGILWARVDGHRATVLRRVPRGVPRPRLTPFARSSAESQAAHP
jgi:transcriptional regulator with XRE-family HTH domain